MTVKVNQLRDTRKSANGKRCSGLSHMGTHMAILSASNSVELVVREKRLFRDCDYEELGGRHFDFYTSRQKWKKTERKRK